MNRTLRGVLTFALGWLTLLPGALSGQTADLPGKGSWTEGSLRIGNLDRWFLVYRPTGLKDGAPTVLLLHGGTQSMRKVFAEKAGGTRAWPALADREGFLLVVPNGTNTDNGDTRGDRQNWNDLRADGGAAPAADDRAFLLRLLDHTGASHRTDSRRTYVTGASNGGMMTYRLLIEAPERFAAGAAFIASLPAPPAKTAVPRLATPLLIANGTADPLVKWEGGQTRGKGERMMSAAEVRDWWVRANRAATAGKEEVLPDTDADDGCRIFRTTFPAGGPGSAPVVFLRMEGAGHALPSRSHALPDGLLIRRLIGPLCRDAEGAELAWQFLSGFRR